MKVILLTDIPKVGKKYEVKEFKDGYAKNVLIGKGLAELATPHALTLLSNKVKKIEAEKAREEHNFAELIDGVNNKHVVIKAKANDKGHLFKQVSVSEVALAIAEHAGVHIAEDMIHLGHIKEVGEYEIVIKKGKKEGKCKLEIVAQK